MIMESSLRIPHFIVILSTASSSDIYKILFFHNLITHVKECTTIFVIMFFELFITLYTKMWFILIYKDGIYGMPQGWILRPFHLQVFIKSSL